MSEQNPTVDKGTGVKLDLTINIPTLLALLGLVAGAITYINGQIQVINNQQLVTVGDVKVLQTQVASTMAAQSSLRADTAGQISQFRSEVRGDLRDLKSSVDQINTSNRRTSL